MAARRGKSQARRNGSNGLPGWAWLVIGVLVTLLVVLAAVAVSCPHAAVAAAERAPADTAQAVRVVLGLSVLAVLPALLICVTSFLRIIIVLSMLRHAIGMPETPPNPVLIGLAVMNGVLEEVVIVGYWFTRMRQAGWTMAAVVGGSAVLRASYHLYQGFGGFVGNLAMGLVFGWLYLRWKRIGPLVAAHVVLDVCAFVGYSLLAPYVDWF